MARREVQRGQFLTAGGGRVVSGREAKLQRGTNALLIGALSATAAALAIQGAPPLVVQLAMVCAGALGGGIWITLSGALRQYRGVNETISSLLLVYIGLAILNHLVEGVMRDPASEAPRVAAIGAPLQVAPLPATARKNRSPTGA